MQVAFAVYNKTGGNLRVGWSTDTATLRLGMDGESFGYGGTATISHSGKSARRARSTSRTQPK